MGIPLAPTDIINALRRITGDTNANDYKIRTQDLLYYLQDAVSEVEIDYPFGYELSITSISASWNKTMYSTPATFFKLRALILVLEGSMHDNLYDSGNVQIGDIKVNITSTLKIRMDNLKRLKLDYLRLMKVFKLGDAAFNSVIVDTYVRTVINNTPVSTWIVQ